MGERLYDPHPANPLGFFEDQTINRINERLLAQVMPYSIRVPVWGARLPIGKPGLDQRWLAELPSHVQINATRESRRKIPGLVAQAPFCFKDPRFCYTLPVWEPYLGDAVIVCVFRHPSLTIQSILRECQRQKYLRSLRFTWERGLNVWDLMYRRVLRLYEQSSRQWVFLEFEQFHTGKAAQILSTALDVAVDSTFFRPNLNRTVTKQIVPESIEALYLTLRQLSQNSHSQFSFPQ